MVAVGVIGLLWRRLCVHDFKVYKTKHPTFPTNLPGQAGSAREGKRANLRQYGDRGYQGAQEVDPDVEVALPIRCKPET